MSETEQKGTERRYHHWYQGERSQRWATPPAFFNDLHTEYGFTLDGASEDGNALLPRASTADNPLPWDGERVFCNPPWSSIPPFVELAGTADLTVLLVPARTNCRWFHRALELGAVPRFFKPKLKFVGAKHVSPVDCVLLVFEKEVWELSHPYCPDEDGRCQYGRDDDCPGIERYERKLEREVTP